MPVLFNKSTGAAENVEDSDSALAAGTHEVPLIDPEGQPVSASVEGTRQLLGQGYRQPNPQQLSDMLLKTKSKSLGQQAIGAAEGAASALTFGGSTRLETELGVDPEGIRAREDNGIGGDVGQIAGIGLGLMSGVGAPEAISEIAGMAAAKLGAKTFAGRVGAAATKAAIENMLFTSGHEASRAFAQDPNQSAESIVGNVGLSGVLGGAIGGGLSAGGEGAKALWQAKKATTLEGTLAALKNKAGGVPLDPEPVTSTSEAPTGLTAQQAPTPEDAPVVKPGSSLPADLKVRAGITLDPDIEGALSGNPEAKAAFQTLQESDTSSARKSQAAFEKFKSDIKDATASAVGKTPDEVSSLHDTSDYDAGAKVQDGLVKTLKATVEPIADKFDELQEKFSKVRLSQENNAALSQTITDMSQDMGLHKAPSSAAFKMVNNVLSELPLQTSAQDLVNYGRNLRASNPYGSDNYFLAKQIAAAFDEAKDSAIETHLKVNAPAVLEDWRTAKQDYAKVKDQIDTLNDRLHVGKSFSPRSFMTNLQEMKPEEVVRRLSTKADAGLQSILKEQFPEVAEGLRQHELNKVLKTAIDKDGQTLDPKKLFKKIQALQPEQRAHLFPPEVQDKLDAIHGLLQRVPERMNPSGTAKTIASIFGGLPSDSKGIAHMILGHMPVAKFLVSHVQELLGAAGRESDDATRLAILKFLGSDAPTSAAGLRDTVEMAQQGFKAEAANTAAAKGVFEGKVDVKEPSAADIDKLKTRLQAVQDKPDILMNTSGDAGHYLPEHAASLAAATSRAVQYVATLKPDLAPTGVLDKPKVASKQQDSDYNQALKLAENPMLLYKRIQTGQLTVKDLQHVNAMYPGLVANMQNKLQKEMMHQMSLGKPINMHTRTSLSLIMAHPLTGGLSPASIQSAQASMLSAQQQRQGPQQAGPSMKHSGSALTKMPNSFMTPGQARLNSKTGSH